MKSIPFKKAGHSQGEAYKMAGYEADARSFRPAAEILVDLRVKSVILHTGNPEKADDLRKASIVVSGTKEPKIWTTKRHEEPWSRIAGASVSWPFLGFYFVWFRVF